MNSILITQDGADGTTALLDIGELRLALPQSEICALESAADIDTDQAKHLSVGWIHFRHERWPVFCLSPDLSPLTIVPKARRSCVVLNTGAGYLGILCDETSFGVQLTLEQQQPLPPAMEVPGSPITGLVALEQDHVACATSSQRLIDYLTQQVNL